MRSPGAKVAKDFEELTNWLYDLAQPGDLILTVGAGDILYCGGSPGPPRPGIRHLMRCARRRDAPSAVLIFLPFCGGRFREDTIWRQ